MERFRCWWFIVVLGSCGLLGCSSVAPAPDPAMPGPQVRKWVNQRMSAVVVTDRSDLSQWLHKGLPTSRRHGDADGGSATPISADGYFLTANHVLAGVDGRNVFVLHRNGSSLVCAKARVVWQSEAADLALLHIPARIQHYYHWSAPDQWLPEGTRVIHGGIATGSAMGYGKLGTALAPEGAFTRDRMFKLDLPLQPGDSGGPVVDAHGGLVGINSAVEYLVPMETAFFVDSEAGRPNLRRLEARIANDRARYGRANAE